MPSIKSMVEDFCQRNLCEYTPEMCFRVMNNNQTIIDEQGFLVFNIIEQELHIIFCYAVPENHYICKQMVELAEKIGKTKGCTVSQFITRRNEKAMERLMTGFHPVGTIFEKELV